MHTWTYQPTSDLSREFPAYSSGTRRPWPGPAIVNLAIPLKPGRYLVVNGGSESRTNAFWETLNIAVPRYRAQRGLSYGVDLVAIGRMGLRAYGKQPTDHRAHRMYGARVLAPCAGRLVAIHGLPDMQIPIIDRDNPAGNHILLRGAEADVRLGHLQPGSMRGAVGADVAVSDWLGVVGKSGDSGEPHLPIHAQSQGSGDALISGDSQPLQFNSRFPVRGHRIPVP